MKDNQSKLNVWAYVALFIVSFIFFVYLTFPYAILKESVLSEINRTTSFRIRVERMEPSLPLGLEAEGITISSDTGGTPLTFKSAEVQLGILNLLIGRLAATVVVETQTGGELEASGRVSLFRLISGKGVVPSHVGLEANKFEIDNIVAFFLSSQANSPTANPLVAGMLTKVGFKGKLGGMVDFDINPDNPSESSGKLNLELESGVLTVDDPNLNLGEQKFKKAKILANIEKGKLVLDKSSGFHTQNFFLDLAGDVQMKPELTNSTLNLAFNIRLEEALKENFGLILDMAGGTGGAMSYKLRGTLASPSGSTM